MAEGIDRWDEAAEVLKTGGWCKGALHNARGEHCLIGALQCVQNSVPAMGVILDQLAEEQYPDRSRGCLRSAVEFNDHPDTTLDDVIALLEKAKVFDG